ncbi:MAG: tRNA dihydrouridine synthase DusB [Syntrophomonadaceae bacterium]|nr:tRNA dihydrouridine synthase DusB [Syntrophomonadaceae bacterium]
MVKIGNVELKNRVAAAPMAGYTDKAFRIILQSFGCGLVYTEMISAKALIYRQEKTLAIADVSDEEPSVAVQIFGSEPDTMAAAARLVVELGADIVDINMGCPIPKIVRSGEGAALMRDPEWAAEMVTAVAEAVAVPVTVKIRAGWDAQNINCCQVAALAAEAGAEAIAIHPRTREQLYSGRADWELIRQVKEQVSVPVIGNGDILSAADARQMIDYTGCDLVMIGRGCLGNPFLMREAISYIEHGTILPPAAPSEKLAAARHHLKLACRFKGADRGTREMRKHLAWYIKGFPYAASTRVRINQAHTPQELETILQELEEMAQQEDS